MFSGADASYLDQEQEWLGASLDSVMVFGGCAGWTDWLTSIQSARGAFAPTGKDVLWSVPLIVDGATLAAAAGGAYDTNYTALAQYLAANSSDDSQIYVRLGWEFNGTGYNAWSAVGQPQNYVGAFQHAVAAFRAVSDKFRFEWTPNKGDVGMNPEDAYPGDQYVDVIGMDFYWETTRSWSIADPVKAWNYFVNEKYGLQWHQDFAAAHNKPTAYAEWAVNSNNASAFIKLAAQWFESHNVLYQSYWNSNSNFQGKLSDNQYPDSGAAYKAAFADATGGGAVLVPNHGTWIGTMGNDAYTVTRLGDVIVEALNGGTDTVSTAMNYTLPANVEQLKLTGTGDQTGTGNAADNLIVGTAGNNVLRGLAGNDSLSAASGADRLEGGAGVDTMSGGNGNDFYLIDNGSDQVIEWWNSGAGGYDIISSCVSYTLPINVEELDLSGSLAINGTGNGQANLMIGNGGINLLNGMGGNDTLNGGAGADIMTGGSGDDRYVVDNIADVIVEYSGGGSDTVVSSVSFTLPGFIENLQLTGIYNMNGYGNGFDNIITGNGCNNTIYGYAGNDWLSGDAGADYLSGGDGNDTLSGGTGADTLIGGNGNDLYLVDSSGDIISESYAAGLGGIDTVQSMISYTLDYSLENLTLTGGGDLNGTGNALANLINGNGYANILSGLDGNDTLCGGAGIDKLYGGTGNDLFVFKAGEANGDVIGDFNGNGSLVGDSIQFQGYGLGAYATIGSGTLTIHYSGGLETISLSTAGLHASDYSFA